MSTIALAATMIATLGSLMKLLLDQTSLMDGWWDGGKGGIKAILPS